MSTPIANDKVTSDILQLLYNHLSNNPKSTGVDRAIIQATLGVPVKEMDDSVGYLETNGLAAVSRASGSKWTFAKITDEGIEVVENKEKYVNKFMFTQTASSQAAEGQQELSEKNQLKLSLPELISEAFRQASNQILSERIPNADKGKIEKQLKSLQRELQRGNKADLGSIQKNWEWIRKNANFTSPMIAPVVLETMKIVILG